MMNKMPVLPVGALLFWVGGAIAVLSSQFSLRADDGSNPAQPQAADMKLETCTFGGGCFWCTEAVFRELKGVRSVESGYSGGKKENPTYEEVYRGFTGHAEVIQVAFDPQQITFPEILEVFWKTHDPTTLNRQGADVGTQYRSVVFFHSDEQKQQAKELKKQLDEAGVFPNPIVTEISPFTKFYIAENYHQKYFERNGKQPYCRAVIVPKLKKFRKVFADKLGESNQADSSPNDSSVVEDIDWSKVNWRKRLTPEQYHVTRKDGTERAFKNAYWDNKQSGVYRCVCCGLPLFDSSTKYQSGTGWPSFFQPVDNENVVDRKDRRLGSVRTEIRCSRCDAHLGHLFEDGPKPTGLRYCINSAALDFVETGASEEKK